MLTQVINPSGGSIGGGGGTGNVIGTGAADEVVFWTGAQTVSGSNNFRWDNTNNRLAVGSDSTLTVGKLFDFSQTITNFSGTTTWYGLQSNITFNPSVDLGTTALSAAIIDAIVPGTNTKNFFRVQGLSTNVLFNGTGSVSNDIAGNEIVAAYTGAGTVNALYGHLIYASNASTTGGVAANIIGIRVAAGNSPTTGASTTLNNGVYIASDNYTGTINTNIALNIDSADFAGATAAFQIKLGTQGALASSITRSIEIVGNNVSNAIRFGSSANIYASASNNLTMSDITDVGGLSYTLSSTSTTINSKTQNNASIILQNQTMTPGVSPFLSVLISPTYTAANFGVGALQVAPTQNGANSSGLIGLSVIMTKATAATVLNEMDGILVSTPVIAGTVTTSNAILIQNQTNANATTANGINFQSTGRANCILWGSALQYGSATNQITMTDSTGASGLDFLFNTNKVSQINGTSTASVLRIQNTTLTYGAAGSAVILSSTFTAEDFNHSQLFINPTQSGANSAIFTGAQFTMVKATAATTLAEMDAIRVNPPTVTGTVTASNVMKIGDQTSGSITTPRGINFTTAGVANSIVWGGSALQYANTTNNIRLADSGNTGGIDFSLSASGGSQTITTFASNLALSASSGIVLMSSARHEYAAGANVVAANDLTLGIDGNLFTITGNTTINAIITANWQAGSAIILKFTGTPTVKNNTAGGAGTAIMLLSGSVDLVAANNTMLGLVYDGTQWQETFRKAA